MQTRNQTVDEMKQGRGPDNASASLPTLDGSFHTAGEMHEAPVWSEAYTDEEEALVEERLKNLGYL